MQVTSASLAEVAGENWGGPCGAYVGVACGRFHEKWQLRNVPKRYGLKRSKYWMKRLPEAADPRRHKQIEFDVAHARQMISIPSTVPEADLLSWIRRALRF